MIWAFTAVSAVVPSILLGWYFHKRDVYPEPARVIFVTFLLGVVVVIPVIFVELVMERAIGILGAGHVMNGFLDAFLVAAVPEETFKLLVLLLYCYRHREFDEPMDGVVYGVMASLGFATLENVMYVADGGLGTAIMRAMTSVPGHATWGAIMGYFVGRAKFAPTARIGGIGIGYVIAVTLHGFYDFPLMAISAYSAEAAGPPLAVSSLSVVTLAALTVSVVMAYLLARKVHLEQMRTLPLPPPWEADKARRRNRLIGAIMSIAGFIMASVGGMCALAFGLVAIAGDVAPDEAVPILVVGLIFGPGPLVIGFLLFAAGLNRLNYSGPAPLSAD